MFTSVLLTLYTTGTGLSLAETVWRLLGNRARGDHVHRNDIGVVWAETMIDVYLWPIQLLRHRWHGHV